jgi:hypothetical protein
MPVPVACPVCKRRLRVPEKYAGRRVTCLHCRQAVAVPLWEEPPAATPATTVAESEPLQAPSTRLGIVALALGLLSVLVLCVPVVGYTSLGLSSIGLLLGLWGLLASGRENGKGSAHGLWLVRGQRVNYPLAGTVTCLIALALTLLPFLFR